MRRFIYISIFIFSLSGCSTTSLGPDREGLLLQVDGRDMQIKGKSISKEFNNYGKLFLTQEILELQDHTIVVYEKALTDSNYELNFPTQTTLKIIFDTQDITPIYINRGLHIYQLGLHNGKILNLLVEQFEDQQISFVYGMSSRYIARIIKRLELSSSRALVSDSIVAKLPRDKGAIQTHWSMKMINFAPLITPQRLVFGL